MEQQIGQRADRLGYVGAESKERTYSWNSFGYSDMGHETRL
jgi:hypothetical protein